MASIDFRGFTADAANASVYTFSGVDIGAADPDRIVVVAAHGRERNKENTSLSVSVGGAPAAQVVYQLDDAGTHSATAGVYAIALPSGTTADVALTFSNEQDRCGIGIYAATGVSNSNVVAASVAAADALNVASPVSGAMIAALSNQTPNAAPWAGATEDYDEVVESSTEFSGASDLLTDPADPLELSAAGAGARVRVAAIFPLRVPTVALPATFSITGGTVTHDAGTWNAHNNGTVTQYEYQLQQRQSDGSFTDFGTAASDLNGTVVPTGVYRLRERAENLGGWSEWSDSEAVSYTADPTPTTRRRRRIRQLMRA